jgi:RecB family exonuclease
VGAHVESVEQRFEIPLDGAVVVGIIDRIERNAEGELVVVDLKTGTPLTDNKVVDDPQLSAYQLALHHPSVADALGGPGEVAGAWLLFVKEGKDGKRYRIAAQEALSPQQLSEFTVRIANAAQLMASADFVGPREKRRAGNGPLEHRWQRVGAVCGD